MNRVALVCGILLAGILLLGSCASGGGGSPSSYEGMIRYNGEWITVEEYEAMTSGEEEVATAAYDSELYIDYIMDQGLIATSAYENIKELSTYESNPELLVWSALMADEFNTLEDVKLSIEGTTCPASMTDIRNAGLDMVEHILTASSHLRDFAEAFELWEEEDDPDLRDEYWEDVNYYFEQWETEDALITDSIDLLFDLINETTY